MAEMAAVHFLSVSLNQHQPSIQIPFPFPLPPAIRGCRNRCSLSSSAPRKSAISVSRALDSPSSSSSASAFSSPPPPPEMELEFLGPKRGADGSYPVERVKARSGEKLLRNIMLDNKIELYATYIVEGNDLLNERTNTELRYLKKKPDSWRLACQTIVGNKENSGKVMVRQLPQWKK